MKIVRTDKRGKGYLYLLASMLLGVAGAYAEPPASVPRESQTIIIDGAQEQWRLEWSGMPQPACAPDGPDWMTCPCMGFAFGERGKLVLIRKNVLGKEERFSFDPLFRLGFDTQGEPGEAVLRRRDIGKNDLEQSEATDFAQRVQARPLTKIMKFGDYDHDGRATEFIVQVGTLPCGKQMSVAVGVSRVKPNLHVLTTADHPELPLILQKWQWEKLLSAKKTITVVDWPCGDHGSETETELELWADKGKIHVKSREYTCPENGQKKKLIREEIR